MSTSSPPAVLTKPAFDTPSAPPLTATANLADLFDEVVHVLLHDDARGDETLVAGGDHRAVAADNPRHQLHGLVAELVGLLDDRALDGAFADAGQRIVLIVEGDDFDLAHLVRVFDRAEDGRAVVGPEAVQRGHFGVAFERVGGVRLGAHGGCFVSARVYALYASAGY